MSRAKITYNGITLAYVDEGSRKRIVCENTLLDHNILVELIATMNMTIDGTSYGFESGMTWAEWVASEYNTNGFKIVNDIVTTSDGTQEVYESVIGTIYGEYGIEDNGTAYTLQAARFSFTIDGINYTARYEMNWDAWVDSEYNTDGYKILDGLVVNSAETHRVETEAVGAVMEDDLVDGEDYILVEMQTQLATPTIELDGDTLNIYDEEGLATSYDILVDGVVMDTVSAVSLISFTFGGTTYQAEEGMTWAEWVGSEYDTATFTIDSNSYIYYFDGDECDYVSTDGTSSGRVTSNTEIESGYQYQIYNVPPENGSYD